MKYLLLTIALLVSFPLGLQAQETVNMKLYYDVKIRPYDKDLLFDTGPRYEYTYMDQGYEGEIIWSAREEVLLLSYSEVSFVKNAIRRAIDRCEKLGLTSNANALRSKLDQIPRISFVSGMEIEVINSQFLLEMAKSIFDIKQNQNDQKLNETFESAIYLLQRAHMFYVRIGHSKAEACLLEQLFCKGHWTECDIVAAKRIRDTTCAMHADYLISWLDEVKISTETWSEAKARQLAGENDLDANACNLWLHEIRPHLEKVAGVEQTNKIMANPEIRSLYWLRVRRTMLCTSLNYIGKEPKLSQSDVTRILSERRNFVFEDSLALKKIIEDMAIKCCRPRAVIVAPEVIPVPVPEVVVPAPVGDCGCGGDTPQYQLPNWSRRSF